MLLLFFFSSSFALLGYLLLLLLFSCFDLQESFGLSLEKIIKNEKEKEKNGMPSGVRDETRNSDRISLSEPIVEFPCENFIADNQQILISKMKRNTYFLDA